MAVSEAQKRASAKYQKKNIASLGCRLKKEYAAAFNAYCAERGKTSSAVLREYVMSCIASNKEGSA